MHEHHPGCGHEPEQNHAEHLHYVSEGIGRMCCAGNCNHPEHQIYAMLEQQNRFAYESVENGEFGTAKKKKRKTKKSGWASIELGHSQTQVTGV